MSEHRASSSVRIGDISGLREELKDDKVSKQRAALQKLLELDLHYAKDLPPGIFRDVMMVRHQESVEVKKLMYCFFQMTADTLQTADCSKDLMYNVKRDLTDRNPVVRAMAVKFVGHLAAQSLVSELIESVKGLLNDGDPLVRKTAVIAVGRLHRLMPTLGEALNLLPALEAKLQDEAPMVAINALAILRDLQATIGTDLQLTATSVRALLLAMTEGSEWNQIVVLEAVSQFTAADDSEASVIVERVLPCLNHANSAVVLTAARVLLQQMETRGGLTWSQHSHDWAGKMLKALEKSAASAEPSIQWVVMKCLHVIMERWSELTGQLEVRNFFLKYDDPPYIKQQKLEIISHLTSPSNVDRVLTELREYAVDVDAAVARRAVECMGNAALRLSGAAERVVSALLELLTAPKTNVGASHTAMVQSIVPTMALIFRAYPSEYESAIGVLCEHLEVVADAEARAALLWVLGEYADFVVDPWQKLTPFCESLESESMGAQLAAITAVTKAYLKVPTEQGSTLALSVLEKATKLDNPDVRHRAFFYWNMLSQDPQLAKEVVLAQRPPLDVGQDQEVKPLIKALVCDVPNLAVVYGVDPNTMGFSANTASGGPPTANGDVEHAVEIGGVLDTHTSDISKANSLDVAALEKRDENGLFEPLSTLKLEDSAPGTVEDLPRPQTDSLIDLLGDDGPSTTPANLMGAPAPTPIVVPAPQQSNDPFSLLMSSPAMPPPAAGLQPFAQPVMPPGPAPLSMQAPPAAPQQPQQWGQPLPVAPAAAPLMQPHTMQAPAMQAPTLTAPEAPAQASNWRDFQAPPAPTAVPAPTPAAPLPPTAALPPLNTQPPSGNPFGPPGLTSPPFTPNSVPGGNALPPLSPQDSLSAVTPSASQAYNPMAPANPYVALSTGGNVGDSFNGGYGGYGSAPSPSGGVDFRSSNGNWSSYSPQTTGMSGYGGYAPQHTGGFSQFSSVNFGDPRNGQQGYGGPGFGQPMMQGGYTMQHTGGSMYGGYGAPTPPGTLMLRRDAGKGLEIYGQFVGSRSSGSIYLQLHMTNHSQQDLSGFMIQFNKNQLGLAPAQVQMAIMGLAPGQSRSVDVALTLNQTYVNAQAVPQLQIALKTLQVGTLFFSDNLPMHVMH